MAYFKDVTSEVVKRLNENIPKPTGGISPDRLSIVKALTRFVDGASPKIEPLFNPGTGQWLSSLSPNPVGPYARVSSRPESPVREALSLENSSTSPDVETFILEVQSDFKPKLLAVSYPKELAKDLRAQFREVERYGPVLARATNPRTADLGKLTFLVFFRPLLQQRVETTFGGVLQDRPGFYIGYQALANNPATALSDTQRAMEPFFYPYGWDYLFYTFWHYLNYAENPAVNPFFGGLPNQIAASGKKVVLVIPILSFVDNAGAIADPAQLESLLLQVQNFIFGEKLQLPALSEYVGRVILAAFSNGNSIVTQILQKAYAGSSISEAYMFDAPQAIGQQWIESADRWARSIYGAGVIRVYAQTLFSNLGKVVNASGIADESKLHQTMDGRRSVVFMSQKGWSALLGDYVLRLPAGLRNTLGIPPALSDPSQVGDLYIKKLQARFKSRILYDLFHPFFTALMLADALRRSTV